MAITDVLSVDNAKAAAPYAGAILAGAGISAALLKLAGQSKLVSAGGGAAFTAAGLAAAYKLANRQSSSARAAFIQAMPGESNDAAKVTLRTITAGDEIELAWPDEAPEQIPQEGDRDQQYVELKKGDFTVSFSYNDLVTEGHANKLAFRLKVLQNRAEEVDEGQAKLAVVQEMIQGVTGFALAEDVVITEIITAGDNPAAGFKITADQTKVGGKAFAATDEQSYQFTAFEVKTAADFVGPLLADQSS